METMLRGELAPDDPVSTALAALEPRSRRLVPLARKLEQLIAESRLCEPIEELSRSYMHMHINRLLRSRHREFELVICDALQRLYESAVARQARGPKSGDTPSSGA